MKVTARPEANNPNVWGVFDESGKRLDQGTEQSMKAYADGFNAAWAGPGFTARNDESTT